MPLVVARPASERFARDEELDAANAFASETEAENDELLGGARTIARPGWVQSLRQLTSLRALAITALCVLAGVVALVVHERRLDSRLQGEQLRRDRGVQLSLDGRMAADVSVRPLPIIIDTDIGDDFDDSWALALALSSPEDYDVKMVLTGHGDTSTRAKIVAKYLELFNRTDVPIGVGVAGDVGVGPLANWAADFDMDAYEGTVHEDGLDKTADIIRSAADPVFLVAIGPQENLAALADRYPEAAEKVGRVFSMFGAVDFCYDHAPATGCAEYNVVQALDSAKQASKAGWPLTIVPLDTCEVRLTGSPWRQLQDGEGGGHPMVGPLLESLRLWGGDAYASGCAQSDVVFDAVALYAMVNPDVLEWEELSLKVGDNGGLYRDGEGGTQMSVAMKWGAGGLDAFQNDFAARILNARHSRK